MQILSFKVSLFNMGKLNKAYMRILCRFGFGLTALCGQKNPLTPCLYCELTKELEIGRETAGAAAYFERGGKGRRSGPYELGFEVKQGFGAGVGPLPALRATSH